MAKKGGAGYATERLVAISKFTVANLAEVQAWLSINHTCQNLRISTNESDIAGALKESIALARQSKKGTDRSSPVKSLPALKKLAPTISASNANKPPACLNIANRPRQSCLYIKVTPSDHLSTFPI